MGWIANVFLVLGNFFVGYKWRPALLLVAIGEAIWLVRCWQLAAWDMMFICVVFLILAIKNYWQWGKAEVVEDYPWVVRSPEEFVSKAMAAGTYTSSPSNYETIEDKPIAEGTEGTHGKVVSCTKIARKGKWAYKVIWRA